MSLHSVPKSIDTVPSYKTPVITTDHFISLSVRCVTFNILGSHFMVPKNLLSSETDACDESQTAFTNCCSLTQAEECSYLTLSEGQLFLLQPHVSPHYSQLLINEQFQFIRNKEQRMKHNTINYKLQPTRCNFLKSIYFYRRSACFRRFLRPSSGEHNCTFSFRYCQTMLLLAASS